MRSIRALRAKASDLGEIVIERTRYWRQCESAEISGLSRRIRIERFAATMTRREGSRIERQARWRMLHAFVRELLVAREAPVYYLDKAIVWYELAGERDE